MNWGIIGCGAVVDKAFLPALKASKGGRLQAVMSRDAKRAQAKAQALGAARSYTRVADMANDPDVELVYIATPPAAHLNQIIECAQAGKHILVEKPMALSVAECRQAVDAAERNGAKLMVCYYMRFNGRHVKARQLIVEGAIGTPVYARLNTATYYPPSEHAWRYLPEQSGGGVLADIGSHGIDLLRFLLASEVTKVGGVCANGVFHAAVEETCCAVLQFESGVCGTLTCSFATPKEDAGRMNSFDIYGTEGHMLAGPINARQSEGTLTVFRGGTTTEFADGRMPHKELIDALEEAVKKNVEPPISGHDGLRTQAVMDAIYDSAKTGRFVSVAKE